MKIVSITVLLFLLPLIASPQSRDSINIEVKQVQDIPKLDESLVFAVKEEIKEAEKLQTKLKELTKQEAQRERLINQEILKIIK